ncbi:hypothetical protein CC79DRAFT_1329635 [Sarocladium strictum]
MIKVPALRKISFIRLIETPLNRQVDINQDMMSPYEIVRGICQDRASQNPLANKTALHNLVDLDLPSGASNVRKGLGSRRTIITRVHAELQIADRFSRDSFNFVDSDKYIGCSKPACYFCFNWLINHKHGYVPPATHHKIIPGCRGPDNDLNESGAIVLKDIYTKICAQLGQHILDFLLNLRIGDSHIRYQYQSTEGSSYAQSRIDSTT